MKYYYLIQNTKCNKYEMNDDQKTRISYLINSFNPEVNVKGKKYRDPSEFLEREAKERYVIHRSSTEPKKTPDNAVEEVHQEIIRRKYNL